MENLRLGLGVSPDRVGGASLRAALAKMAEAGLDHVGTGDHISFHSGHGRDGLITATALAMLHPGLPVYVAVYLLPLRHPVVVARQLATFSSFAPGRLIFGVGVGGEDPHEVEICGVDPHTRGRRMDEALEVLRRLLTGQAVTFHGTFFDLDEARILPPPAEPIPIVIGGRSEAAVRRAGRYGEGWLGIWVSARRFASALELIEQEAAAAGRGAVRWRNAMQVWCGLGPSKEEAQAGLADAMQSTYQIPFERFERYSPSGRPEDVAEFLSAYLEAGCREFNLIAVSADLEAAIAGAAEVKRLLGSA